MSGILHISEGASLALHAMALLADNPDKLISTHKIASELDVSEAHLAKVLQRLTKVGLLHSIRGPKGGFRLARNSDQITLLDVYQTIDGPLTETSCVFGTPICHRDRCVFGSLLGKIHGQVDRYFSDTKLSHLVNGKRSKRT